MNRSIFLISFFSTQRAGSNPLTSHANWAECREASNWVMGAAPDTPARRAFHVSSVPIASGDTSPTPVTTTLRSCAKTSDPSDGLLLGLVRVLVDVVDGFLDPGDLLGVLVGNLDAELLLEGHHELDGIEAVRSEVVHERGLGSHQLLFDAELVHDDLLDAIRNRLHHSSQDPPVGGTRF